MTRLSVFTENHYPKSPEFTISRDTNMEKDGCVNEAEAAQILKLGGMRLSFDKRDAEHAVNFVPKADRDSPVRAAVYSRIGNSHVDFKMPGVRASCRYERARWQRTCASGDLSRTSASPRNTIGAGPYVAACGPSRKSAYQ